MATLLEVFKWLGIVVLGIAGLGALIVAFVFIIHVVINTLWKMDEWFK